MQEFKKATYSSPEVETMAMKSTQVICGSYDGSPANMDWGDENGNNWQ